ncbi:MAG TPA: DNA mismatch repair protein MutS [Candidatus Fraserbacteria bacterium]|nr:DNA mismatch repair protein MutS [Candidatus Fraserbacteria bacterium]
MAIKQTPMMQQYFRLKARHPGVILFFQLGEFYETFYDDAELCARELELVLTQRDKAPMAGVPFKRARGYIARLLKRGYKVALCDQLQDPKEAKGLVERDVVQVITPGTVLDDELLERGVNNYIAAILPEAEGVGWAVADLSTGEFRAADLPDLAAAHQELARFRPSELLLPQGRPPPELEPGLSGRTALTEIEARCFRPNVVSEQFGLISLAGLGLSERAGRAAGGLLDYLRQTQKEGLGQLRPPSCYTTSEQMGLDPFTQRNLELVTELRGNLQGATLFGVLNRTVTAMGERLLRRWIGAPLLGCDQIEARLDAVERLAEQEILRAKLRSALAQVYDLERLAGKLGARRANPRDLLSLGQSLGRLPALRSLLTELSSSLDQAQALARLSRALTNRTLEELARELGGALRDDAPFTLKEGSIFQAGYSAGLDERQERERVYKQKILALERRERTRTQIPTLKVGYNNVFGYYLEVSRRQAAKVPDDYIRKQTLKAAERYFTPELKEYEEKILAAQEGARQLEYELFCQLRERVSTQVRPLQELAAALAELDLYAALAETAKRYHYMRPSFTAGRELEIVAGRHPVVERLQAGQEFVPNDLCLEGDETLVILTGPNMAGKSTFLRQTALICIMAQMGSFVPARSAKLPLVDKIFTRVGASDMLASGYSTFMVEMLETANILNNATPASLVILDEMGRGTSTFDGVSIAWAVVDYLVQRIRAKTLFATHYHELTLLEEKLAGVVNMNVLVQEYDDQVIFLHQVARGKAQGSYGVQVAKLAGLPQEVTEMAAQVLAQILRGNPLEAIEGKRPQGPKFLKQATLFGGETHPVIEALKKIDVNSLTPLEALNLLQKLKGEL